MLVHERKRVVGIIAPDRKTISHHLELLVSTRSHEHDIEVNEKSSSEDGKVLRLDEGNGLVLGLVEVDDEEKFGGRWRLVKAVATNEGHPGG